MQKKPPLTVTIIYILQWIMITDASMCKQHFALVVGQGGANFTSTSAKLFLTKINKK